MKVIIDNSISRCVDLNVEQLRALRTLLSYKIPPNEAYYSPGRSPVRYMITPQGYFPTGLLPRVLTAYPGIKISDLRVKPVLHRVIAPAASRDYLPYPEQIEAAKSALIASRGIICAPTGMGKSLICELILDEFQVPTLIVVPSLELKRQLTQSLARWVNTNQVTVQNIDALDPSKAVKGIDLLIIDEFHHSAAKTYRQLNKKAWAGIYYRIGLTATPYRSKSSEQMLLESILSDLIYEVTYEQAVSKGYIVPVEPYYLNIPVKTMTGNDRHWGSVYSELVVNNDIRNLMTAVLLKRLHTAGKSTLCLVKEISHGKTLSDLTLFPFANGQDGSSRNLIRAFSAGEINTLIATSGVCGEGVDTKPAEYVILAGGGMAKVGFMQSVGRGVRRYPGKESAKIILLRDSSHKYLLKHFNACVKNLKDEYGIVPSPIELE